MFPSVQVQKNVAFPLLGLLLGALIFLLEFIDHTFKKPEEVERHLGLMLSVQYPSLRVRVERQKTKSTGAAIS